jgi:hypothetical protein
MVPMHLGLIDGPFVPHDLISAKESPVPLPKFQVAPRLNILMFCGSKKGTQIYFPFLSKSPGKQIPSRFPNGAHIYIERYLLIGYFYISLHISHYLKGPKIRASLHGPQKWAPCGNKCPFQSLT